MLVRKTRGRRGKPDESLEPLYDSLHQTAQVRSVLHQQAERLQHQVRAGEHIPHLNSLYPILNKIFVAKCCDGMLVNVKAENGVVNV